MAKGMYQEKLAARQALKDRIEILRPIVHEASNDRYRKQQARMAAANVVKGHQKPRTAFEEKELEEYRAALVKAQEEEDAAEEKYPRLNRELTKLEEELMAFRAALDAEDVLAFQKDVAAAREKAAGLRDLIGQQQHVIAEASASVPTFPDRKEERENLLVDIATGMASEADLKQLDAKIKKEADAVAKAREQIKSPVEQARQTMSGLERRLEEAEVQLKALEEKKGEVLYEFLMARAEKLGGEYAALAEQLVERYKQIMAINSAVLGIDDTFPKLLLPGYDTFSIPLFALRSHAALDAYQGCLAAAQHAMTQNGRNSALEEERKSISALGVELD